MSGLEHVKDEAGNDIWFGDGGELRFPPGNHITDFKQQLKRLKTLQLRSDDVIVVGYPKTAKKVKVVYITRNPKDVFVSMFCFLHKFDPPMGYRGTWEQFFPFMLKEGWWFGNLFDYLLDWDQEIENHPDIPVYRICYEETLRVLLVTGKNWFTVAQNEEFDRVYREKMADSKITFTFE
nr:hypothetical protein BaRGS_027565 [Batillaria attramentaria]